MRGPIATRAANRTVPMASTARQTVPVGIPGMPCIPTGML